MNSGDFMLLDNCARENLELVHQYKDSRNKFGSLLWLLDETKTAMGARRLTTIIVQPLQSVKSIDKRLDAVAELVNSDTKAISAALDGIQDVSRLSGRIGGGAITPREMIALAESLRRLDALKKGMGSMKSRLLIQTHKDIVPLPEAIDLITRAIKPDPPIKLDDGGYINAGFDAKLDELMAASTQGINWLNALEEKERAECGIKEMKIGFNRISGYYFEVPIRLSDKVPYRFTRRATTANTERYITQELKELEEKITGVQDKLKMQEAKLLTYIRGELKGFIAQIMQNSDAVALVDVLVAFAAISKKGKWTRPTMNDEGQLKLKDARHPVLEKLLGSNKFISNDVHMKRDDKSLPTTMLITGPNMAGKSTYMRTVAINVLLAHIGCFVPAASAQIPLTDRIFTRIGASDSQLTGQSTFMMEMNEVSNIIHNATSRSLLLLDEIGRGTGTRDGFALASSIITYITNKIGALTMFATHFHGLTDLEEQVPGIQNFKVLVSEIDGQIVFLHKVSKGAEQNSFGIDVAKLSGIPDVVIKEAKKIMKAQPAIKAPVQMTLDSCVQSETEERIKRLDINSLTPIKALEILNEMKSSL